MRLFFLIFCKKSKKTNASLSAASSRGEQMRSCLAWSIYAQLFRAQLEFFS
jgi:hypothetical protein